MTQYSFNILIVDRNPHVLEFLRREFTRERYRVLTAKNVAELLRVLRSPDQVDILVLDLDLPDMNGSNILDTLEKLSPGLPVVLHCLAPEEGDLQPLLSRVDAFVEKQGSSVEGLKMVIRALLPPGKPARKTGELDSGRGFSKESTKV